MNIAFSVTIENRLKHTQQVLEALTNVIKNNTEVELQCIGYSGLLFNLLLVTDTSIQKGALNVISAITRNNECINDIASADVIGNVLLLLYTIQDKQPQILDVLYALMSNTKIVREALSKGNNTYLFLFITVRHWIFF